MTLAKYVSPHSMARGRFNYYEVSLTHDFNGQSGKVYLSTIAEQELNLAIIKVRRFDKERQRNDWYFGTFQGKSLGQCQNTEETAAFYKQLERIVKRKNRVPLWNLARTLLTALTEASVFAPQD